MNALQDTEAVAGQQAAWYLIHCKPRQDERAEEHLTRQGYACYRPRVQRESLVRGRRQSVWNPCFPATCSSS